MAIEVGGMVLEGSGWLNAGSRLASRDGLFAAGSDSERHRSQEYEASWYCGPVRQVLANPYAFARASFRRGFRIVGVWVLLEDPNDLLDWKIRLCVPQANTSDTKVAHGAIEVRREDLSPGRRVISSTVFVKELACR
jgi:hypothetical protein